MTRARDELYLCFPKVNTKGGPAMLQSRTVDDSGYVQPSRDQLIAERGAKTIYHYNGITSWGVSANGELSHVYA